ncbi:branched-chain amino acid aminotransferase [Helicobacter mehlei]|uniref:Branched-chain-amino-acid aminotransferase n=1 Tax=Helicobacter mehlei TaxID=2316080 RepID=A0A553V0M9_9HELI|nr:branched-chain amino acid aminotransferase [Helicobacter mehlei]TSA85995.1 branched-chain amino acid aminotransferase [Helicobacter mehlei]
MSNLDWNNLGFTYVKTDFRFVARYKNGSWSAGELIEDNQITLHECAPALHYGQQCFEGLKAYRCKDGSINLFRPEENAKRLQASCKRLLMAPVPVDFFVDACIQVAKANAKWVGPYGSGATLYIRPLVLGVGAEISLAPAREFLFIVFCMPVGPYLKGGLQPANFVVSDYDRAAPQGTGAVKVGGNYAASALPAKLAKEQNFSDCVYLDAATHTKIEEVGAANFYAISKKGVLVTPASPSILPSITKYSLLYLAKEQLGIEVLEGDVYIDSLDEYSEAGVCGTAAVIVPVGGIFYKDKMHVFYSQTEAGPVTKQLYHALVNIQLGDAPAPEGWIVKVS